MRLPQNPGTAPPPAVQAARVWEIVWAMQLLQQLRLLRLTSSWSLLTSHSQPIMGSISVSSSPLPPHDLRPLLSTEIWTAKHHCVRSKAKEPCKSKPPCLCRPSDDDNTLPREGLRHLRFCITNSSAPASTGVLMAHGLHQALTAVDLRHWFSQGAQMEPSALLPSLHLLGQGVARLKYNCLFWTYSSVARSMHGFKSRSLMLLLFNYSPGPVGHVAE